MISLLRLEKSSFIHSPATSRELFQILVCVCRGFGDERHQSAEFVLLFGIASHQTRESIRIHRSVLRDDGPRVLSSRRERIHPEVTDRLLFGHRPVKWFTEGC